MYRHWRLKCYVEKELVRIHESSEYQIARQKEETARLRETLQAVIQASAVRRT